MWAKIGAIRLPDCYRSHAKARPATKVAVNAPTEIASAAVSVSAPRQAGRTCHKPKMSAPTSVGPRDWTNLAGTSAPRPWPPQARLAGPSDLHRADRTLTSETYRSVLEVNPSGIAQANPLRQPSSTARIARPRRAETRAIILSRNVSPAPDIRRTVARRPGERVAHNAISDRVRLTGPRRGYRVRDMGRSRAPAAAAGGTGCWLSLIHISEPTRPELVSRMPSSA